MPLKNLIRCTVGLVCLSSLALFTQRAWGQERGQGLVRIENVNPDYSPDYSRLPVFSTSKGADYDAFLNEYFMRNLSVDENGIYFKIPKDSTFSPTPGATGVMEKIMWDAWFLPWVDAGAMGLLRQPLRGDPDSGEYFTHDFTLTGLLQTGMDKYGYVYNRAANWLEQTGRQTSGNSFMWSWPFYFHNDVCQPVAPTGWEFQGGGSPDPAFITHDFELDQNFQDNSLAGTVTGADNWVRTPAFNCDVFHLPLVTVDIKYQTASGQDSDEQLAYFRLYWKREGDAQFSEERSVGIDFAVNPPMDSPSQFNFMVGEDSARYSLHFPMYLHPLWQGRITQLMIRPISGSAPPGSDPPEILDTRVLFNYIRATYDLRLPETNATLIDATYRYLMWGGDRAISNFPAGKSFLETMLVDLRRAMLFMNEHLKGKTAPHLLDFSWMVGHDGKAGPDLEDTGHGQASGYWDLSPHGRYDLSSSAHYYEALKGMAEIEAYAAANGITVPPARVVGPDNETIVTYSETPESLHALAEQVKSGIEQQLWNSSTGRFVRTIDSANIKHDYGYIFDNLQALFFGLGTEEQQASIYSWIDGGRTVIGDNSQGDDIYRWRFAPRTTTRHNHSYYPWNWAKLSQGADPVPPPGSDCDDPERIYSFGGKFENGGAVAFTSLFDLVTRTRSGDQAQIDYAYQRTLDIQDWFEDVKASNAPGTPGIHFYDSYYGDHDDNPDLGCLQGGTRGAGGLGLDREFLSSGAMGSLFALYGFLGIDSVENNIIDVAPALPTDLDFLKVTNVYYRGNHLTIEAGRVGPSGPSGSGDYVSFDGSTIPNGSGLKARLTFRSLPDVVRVFQDGVPVPSGDFEHDTDKHTLTLLVDLDDSYIFVQHVADLEDFRGTPNRGLPPLLVTFDAEMTGDIDGHLWAIGHELVGNPELPFEKVLGQPGIFDLGVTIDAGGGQHTEVKQSYFELLGEVPAPLDFDFPEDLDGWSSVGIGKITETEIGVQLPIASSAPQFLSPAIDLDPGIYETILLRLRIEGSPLTSPAAGRIYFRTAQQPTFAGHGVDFTLPAGDNRWRTIVVDMSANPAWSDQGQITALRIDPIYNHIGQVIHLGRVQSRGRGYLAPYQVDFSQGIEGWRTQNLSEPVQTPEGLRMEIEQDDPKLLSPTDLALNGTLYNTIKVRLRIEDDPLTAPVSGRIFFGTEQHPTYSADRRLSFSVPAGDQWQIVTIDAGAHAAWGNFQEGRITKMRLKPVMGQDMVGRTLHIAEVWVEHR